jgi:hypothetical protein
VFDRQLKTNGGSITYIYCKVFFSVFSVKSSNVFILHYKYSLIYILMIKVKDVESLLVWLVADN